MRVLVACEESGTVRNAFRNNGHDAYSCDIQLSSDNSPYHYQCDIREVLYNQWDMVIAHPPCTYLNNAGVRWLYEDQIRWQLLDEAAQFFRLFTQLTVAKLCIENPIPHKYAIQRIGYTYNQLIQPYQFGHAERKATCLWLKGLPKLKPTNDCYVEMLNRPLKEAQRIHYAAPGKDRAKLRSKTYSGIAQAMADQWGIP